MSTAAQDAPSLLASLAALAGSSGSPAAAAAALQAAIAAGYVPKRQLTGQVVGVWGDALIRLLDGSIVPLKVGDVVKKGEVVLTTQDGIVQLEAAPDVAAIDRVIEQVAQGDPLAAPAAGLTPGDGGGLLPGLRVDRVAEAVAGDAFTSGGDTGAVPTELSGSGTAPEDSLRPTLLVATPDSTTTAEDTPITFDPRGNDSTTAGGGLTIVSVGGQPITVGTPVQLPEGSVILNPDGTLTFTPNPDFTGTVNVDYGVSDGVNPTVTTGISIEVTPVNDAPVAGTVPDEDGDPVGDPAVDPDTGDYAVTTPEDTPVSGVVRATDADGDPLTFSPGSDPTHGTVTVNPDGSWTYTPDPDYTGPDSFTVVVTDPSGATSTATVVIGVTPVNDNPVARADSAATPEDTPVSGNVLSNDTDADGDPLAVTGFSLDTNGDGVPESFGPGATATIAGVGQLTLGGNGRYTFTPAPDYSGPVPEVTYTVTDGQGGSATGTLSLAVDPSPEASITLDPNITTDDILNAAEAGGTVPVIGTVGGDVKPGDTVTLTINGTAYTGVVQPGGTFSIDVPGAALAADPDRTIGASVTTTDAAGNSATATDTEGYTVDTTPPVAAIRLDPNITPDDILSSAEAGTTIPVTGTVGGDVKPGDTVTLTINGVAYVGLVLAGGTFSIDVPGSALAADPDRTIGASVTTTDAAGNSATATDTEGYTVDTTPPVATITLDPNITPDDILNAAEAGGTVPVTGTVGGDVKPGDTVTLTINGTAYTGVVQPGGTFSIDVPGAALAADPDRTIGASVTTTDAAGNSATATDTEGYTVDTTPPVATITLDPNITPDDILNAAEAGGTVPVTGTVGGDVKPGDTVTLTINGAAYTGVVQPGSTFSIDVPGSALAADPDRTIGASVTTTDAAGNSATATDTEGYTVDTTPPVATITLDPNITPDDILNAAEAGGTVPVTGTVGGDVKPGDTVTLTINGTAYTGLVLAGGTFSIDVPGSALAADPDRTIGASVTTTDAAGNSATATDTEGYTVDTTAPVATITLDPNITPDDILNAAEAGGTVPVTGTVGGDVKPGDTVTLTINGTSYTGVVQPGGTFSVDVPGSALAADPDSTIGASVTTTDAAGNSATATDTEGYTVDTTPPVATITLDPNITPDDILSSAEAGTTIPVTGTVGGDVKPGDTVTLTINGVAYVGLVLAGGTFSIDVPGSALAADPDRTIGASVTTTDAAGNSATATDTEGYTVDTTPPVAAITLDPNITPDDILNAAEAGGTVPVTGTVGGDVKPGDTVTLTINGTAYTGLVLAGGTFSIDVPGSALAADPDRTIGASVTTTDAAGNSATATDTEGYTVDTTPPVATITLDPNITPDDILSSAEAGTTIPVTGTVGGDVKPGDTVTLTINGVAYVGLVLAGGTFSVDVPGSALAADPDRTIGASVTTTDAAGNSATATDTEGYTVDTTPPVATITLDPNITPDDILNAAEAGGTVPVTGTVGGDVKPGDTVTLTINGTAYTGLVLAGGTFSIDVPGSALAADPDRTIGASVTTTDAAGNSATATDTEGYTVDTTAPVATITLDPNITPDDILNAAEAGGTVPVTGTVGGDVKPGDTVTLTINDTAYTGVVQPGGTFSIDVPGSALAADPDRTIGASVTTTDAAGNSVTATDTEGYTVDTTPPVATITLDPNITPDDILNAAEAGSTVPVTGTVGGDVKPGDTVTLTINGTAYTGLVLADGTFSIDVPGSALAADPDRTINASVTTTDTAGNSATATDSEGYSVNLAPTLDLDSTTAGTGSATRFNENGAAVALADLDLEVSDPDSATLQGATIVLTNPQPGDVLAVGALPPGISATLSGNTITLSGGASVADYEAALRSITFDNTGSDPSTVPRTVDITVNDGVQDSNTATATVGINTVEPVNDPGAGAGYSFGLGNYAANDLWTDADSTGQPVRIDAFNADGSPGSLFLFDTSLTSTDNSLGVAGTTRSNATGVPGQIEHDRVTGQSESLVVQLNGLANQATFDVASMNPTEDGGEGGRWVALYEGTVVATGEFSTTPPNSSATFTIDTGDAVFDAIRFEARPTGNNSQTLDGSDYYLAGLSVSGPAAVNTPYTLSENAVLTIPSGSADSLLANDSDAEGDSFSLTAIEGVAVSPGQTVTLASGALLTVQADGSFVYDPNGAFDGLDAGEVANDTFTYTVTDADGASDTASATMTIVGVNPTNTSPTAANDAFTTGEDTALTIVPGALLGNDDDPEANPLRIVSVQDAVNGTVALVNGRVVFTPAPDYEGAASFTYTITDDQGGTSTATVDITVEPRPDASITLDSAITADDIVSASEAGGTVSVTGQVGGDVQVGDTVTLNVNGQTYTGTVQPGNTFSIAVPGAALAADPDRSLSASVTTRDAAGNAATATDTETYSVNTGVPVAANGSAVTSEDTPYVFRWSDFGITDTDGGPAAQIRLGTLPADGTLQVFSGGTWVTLAAGALVTKAQVDAAGLRFVPDANESGDGSYAGAGTGNQQADYASFTFAPSDGVNTGATRSFTLDVTPVADGPVTSLEATQTTLPAYTLPTSQGLRWDYYDELAGADPTTAVSTQAVENALESQTPTQSGLATNVYLAGTTPGMPAVEAGGQADVRYTEQDDASRFSGFIFLEAGKSYSFSGLRDDTMRIELGGDPVYDRGFNNWGTYASTTYTPAVSGFYSLELVYYNGNGAGGLDVNVSVDGAPSVNLATDRFVLLQDGSSVEQSGVPADSFVGVGTDGGGYYPLPAVNTSGALLPLDLGAVLSDTDGSEQLSLQLSGLPDGFTVSDGVHSAVVGGSPLDVSGWNLDALGVRATPGYSGSARVSFTATATEANGDSQSSSETFDLVYSGNQASVTPVDGAAPAGSVSASGFPAEMHWSLADRAGTGSEGAEHTAQPLDLRDLLQADAEMAMNLDVFSGSTGPGGRPAGAAANADSVVADAARGGSAAPAALEAHAAFALGGMGTEHQVMNDLMRQARVDAA